MDLSYLKTVLRYLLSAVLSIVLVAYIIYHVSGGFQPDLETVPAAVSTADATLTVNVSLFRQETVLYAPVTGNISYLFTDGSKVALNTPVAEIYPVTTGSSDTWNRIIAIDEQIRLLQSSNMSDAEKRTDTTSTDLTIRGQLSDILKRMDRFDISGAAEIANDFLVQLNRRRIITHTVSHYNAKIADLQTERDALSAGLFESETTVTADSVGYFYSTVDGYENLFSASQIASLTYRGFLSLHGQAPETYTGTGKGYPIGKLVTDYVWYVACEVDSEELHNFERGVTYRVTFPYNNDINLGMYLYRILSDVDSETAVLIFRADTLPIGFRFLRSQAVQITKHSYTGYRIPASAVHIVNGKPGVYILRGHRVAFRRVEPLYEADGYLIVKERNETAADRADWLAKNESVIVKGKDLYDGKIVN